MGALIDQVFKFHLVAETKANYGVYHNILLVVNAVREYPVYVFAALGMLFIVRRRLWNTAPVLVWLLLTIALLLKQQPLFEHHLVLLSPVLALLGALFLTPAGSSKRAQSDEQWLRYMALGVVILATGAFALRDDIAQARPVPAKTQAIVATLGAFTLPGDEVVTDNEYYAGLANRTVPPQLVDTSAVRVATGYINARFVEQVIVKDNVQAVLFDTGRLESIRGLKAWVEERFTKIATFGHGQELFIRRSQSPLPS